MNGLQMSLDNVKRALVSEERKRRAPKKPAKKAAAKKSPARKARKAATGLPRPKSNHLVGSYDVEVMKLLQKVERLGRGATQRPKKKAAKKAPAKKAAAKKSPAKKKAKK